MNRALVVALLRQRLASPMRLVLLLMLIVPGLGAALLTHSLTPVAGSGYWFALILAAGAIGQDFSSGVLHLTFARPVTRPTYVLSRWFAAAFGAFALSLAQVIPVALTVAANGGERPLAAFAAVTLENFVLAAAGAAVMVCLSSLVDGLGDVGLFALGTFTLEVGRMLATFKHWSAVEGVIGELQKTLHPQVSFGWLAGQGSPEWTGLAIAASTIALGLAIAIVRVNRRELSYAAG